MLSLRPALAGLLLSTITIAIAALLPADKAHDALAAILVGIAAISVGFAIADGRRTPVIIETATALAFLAIALAGLWVTPLILAAGYIAHGIWDLVHRPHGIATPVTPWYPPFCVVYDWIVGAYIAIAYLLPRSA